MLVDNMTDLFEKFNRPTVIESEFRSQPPMSFRTKDVELVPAEQFSFNERVKPKKVIGGERIYYDKGPLVMQQRENLQEYVYLRKKGDETSMVTLQLTPEGKVQKIMGIQPADKIAASLDTNKDVPLANEIRHYLKLPAVTPELRQKVRQDEQDAERSRQKIAKIAQGQARLMETMTDRDDAVEVLQKEAGITKADRPHRFLKTFGAGPCVILALYDKESKTGSLVHLDGTTDVKRAVSMTLARMNASGASPKGIEASLVGGQRHQSEDLIINITNELEKEQISVKGRGILTSDPSDSKAVIMDTATGELYNLRPRGQYFQSRPDHEARLMASRFGHDIRFVRDPDAL